MEIFAVSFQTETEMATAKRTTKSTLDRARSNKRKQKENRDVNVTEGTKKQKTGGGTGANRTVTQRRVPVDNSKSVPQQPEFDSSDEEEQLPTREVEEADTTNNTSCEESGQDSGQDTNVEGYDSDSGRDSGNTDSGSDGEKSSGVSAAEMYRQQLKTKNIGMSQKQMEDKALKFGKEVVYKNQKFIHEKRHLTLTGAISTEFKKHVGYDWMSEAEWSEHWDIAKPKIVTGHQIKRSEHGTKQRLTFYGKCATLSLTIVADKILTMCL